jgi:hypothetical protein
MRMLVAIATRTLLCIAYAIRALCVVALRAAMRIPVRPDSVSRDEDES